MRANSNNALFGFHHDRDSNGILWAILEWMFPQTDQSISISIYDRKALCVSFAIPIH